MWGTLGDRIVDYTLRAGISTGVGQAVYGDEAGSFGTALVESFVASASAEAASFIGSVGQNPDILPVDVSPDLLPALKVAAHGLGGCAAAAAGGHDCGAGALGGAVAATVNPLLDQFTSDDSLKTRNGQLGVATTAVTGVIAAGLGAEVDTAIRAAQNETFNNYLRSSQKTALLDELAECPDAACTAQVRARYLLISAGQDALVALKVAGGAAESTVGAAVGLSAGWTGIGAVVGGVLFVHGADVAAAGVTEWLTTEPRSTVFSQGLQPLGSYLTRASAGPTREAAIQNLAPAEQSCDAHRRGDHSEGDPGIRRTRRRGHCPAVLRARSVWDLGADFFYDPLADEVFRLHHPEAPSRGEWVKVSKAYLEDPDRSDR
jgi:hypothetical protein